MIVGRGARVVSVLSAAVSGLAMAAGAAGAPGWDPYPGVPTATIDGYARLQRVEVDRDGAARVHAEIQDPVSDDNQPSRNVVVTRSSAGAWTAPADTPAPAVMDAPARAAVVAGRVVVALRNADGTLGADQDVAPAGRLPVSGARPTAAVGVNGDAVVAWLRRAGNGTRRLLLAATRPAGGPWSASQVVAGPDTLSDLAVAVDLRGTAILLWGQGAHSSDPAAAPLQTIRVAERGIGAPGWSAPTDLGMGHGSYLAVATDGAGTAFALWGRSFGQPMLTAVRTPGAVWRRTGAVPGSGCCAESLEVSPLGDAFILDPNLGQGRIRHRAAGSGQWEVSPEQAVPDLDGTSGITVHLDVNAAGDAVLGWIRGVSNTSQPLRAAYFEAPARPSLLRLRARRVAGRARVELLLTGPGRVLIHVRRAGSARILDGFIVTAAAARATVTVPARVQRLLRPGHYVLRADTGSHDVAASVRETTLSVR